MTRKLKIYLPSLFVAGWFLLVSPSAQADQQDTVQVSPSDTSTVTTISSVTIIESAQNSINQAETTTAQVIINAQTITQTNETITAVVQKAQDSIVYAQNAVDTATAISVQVDSATALVQDKEEEVAIAQIAVDSQTAVISNNIQIVDSATAIVQSSTSPGLNVKVTQNIGVNNAPPVEVGNTTYVGTAPHVNYNYGLGGPPNTYPEDFQIKFSGQITSNTTEDIRFYAPADDGVKLYLDNQLVINDWFDKGGGGSVSNPIPFTANVPKNMVLHFYENGGGANVVLQWNKGGTWAVVPPIAFTTSSATPEQLANLQQAQSNLLVAQQVMQILNNDLQASQQQLANAQENLAVAQQNLNNAIVAIQVAVSTMNDDVTNAQNIVSQQIAAEESARQAEIVRQAEIARQAAIAAEQARIAAQQAYEAEQARLAAEAARAKAEAEAKAAAEAAAKAEAERIAAEKAAAEKLAAEEKAKAEEEAKLKAEAEAKAKAELEAKLKAEEEAKKLAEEKAKEEAKAKAEAEAKAKAELEAKLKAEAEAKALKEKLDAEEKAKAEEEALKEAAKKGELTEEQKEIVVTELVENLKPGESLSLQELKNSGVSFADLPPTTPVELRTDENGNALVITAEVATQIELIQDPGALLETALTDPGAAIAALGSIGADMTEAEREEATDMVVATVVAAGAAINAVAAVGGTTGGSTGGGGGSSGGGSGANSPGSRGGRRW